MQLITRRIARILPLALVLAVAVPLAGLAESHAGDMDDQDRPPLAASVEAYGAGMFVGNDRSNADANQKELAAFGGSARVLARLPADLGVQLDVEGENYTNNDEGIDNFDESVLGAGHFHVRNGENFLFGGFGGYGYSLAEGDRTELWFVGAEGQLYLGPVTLYGQGGYLDTVNDGGGGPTQTDGDALHEAPFGRGVVRYFPTDNVRLQFEGSYARGQQDNDDQLMDAVGWGARVDAGLPLEMEHGLLSVFAGYSGGYYDNDGKGATVSSDTGSRDDHTVRVGITFSFGAEKTLLDRDRNGANLDLPPFGLWTASGFIVD